VADTLVIGYGSDLRGDDAAGRLVVRALETKGLPGVATLEVHQLTPEVAAEIAGFGSVIFVDATVAGDDVGFETLVAAPGSQGSAHHATPQGLLALAADLYGATPAAGLVAVPVERFDLGSGLSERARRGVRRAVELISDRVCEHGESRSTGAFGELG